MNIISFIIVAMFLFQVSIYAQSTGQVTLSIRLYPIQIIEVDPSNTQSFEISNENIANPSPSLQLSTFSTSNYCLKVDTIKINDLKVSQLSNGIPPKQNSSAADLLNEEYDDSYWDNDYQIVYSMETL